MVPVLVVSLMIAVQGGGRASLDQQGQTREVAVRPAAPAIDLNAVVAAPVYQPDGAMSVETVALSASAPSFVHVYSRRSLCDAASTSATEPTDAGFGWRLASRTVSVSPTQVVVSVDWRRMWDRGKKIANGPAGTVQLTLHTGDRIPLDLIPNAAPSDACHAVGMGLEVRAARATTVPPANATNAVLPIGANEGGAAALDADLWLLHTPPSGAQQVVHQTVGVPTDGSAFTFAPLKVSTAGGEVGVELAGVFRRYRIAATGDELLEVSMTRLISNVATSARRSSGASTLIALPGPGDVLQFELPTDTVAAGRGGGRGGRGAGGGAGSPTAAAPGTATPPSIVPRAPSGTMVAGGGGGGARGTQLPAGSVARLTPVLSLEGHDFSLRVRLTPK